MAPDGRARGAAPRRLGAILPWLFLALVLAVLPVLRFTTWHLPPLPAAAPPVGEGPQYVFGYATLARPIVRLVVVGRPVPSEPARLEGWERQGRTLVRRPEGAVEGRLFRVEPDELRRLDRYEQAGLRYHRLPLRLADGRTAWVYVRALAAP